MRRALTGPLARLVAGRVLSGIVMLWVISVAVFFFTQALPGDVASAILGRNATPEAVAHLRDQLGLDHSVVHQYLAWLGNLFEGNFGQSLANHDLTVGSIIGGRAENSLALVVLTSAIAFPAAFLLGLTAARNRGGLVDTVISSSVLVLMALPEFVIAVLVVVIFATSVLHVLPAVSTLDPSESPWSQPELLALPVLALVLGALPYLTQMVRATMIDVLDTEYVTWARLNGVPERRVVWRHALRNSAAPAVQVATIILIYLTGGIVAVETVFSYPGLGLALVEAVSQRDLPVVQAITMLLAATALLLYLLSDVIVVLLTPKLRTRL
ncbi:MAG: ABC transporter permease [Solirubrobacterales bacterium]